MKIALKQGAFQKKHGMPWKSCLPFVDNKRALLIHRPARVTTYRIHALPHTAVNYWCGNGSSGTDIFSFLDSIGDDKILCERCERNAVLAGLPSADELSGRHVHKGKIVAIQTCCEMGKKQNG